MNLMIKKVSIFVTISLLLSMSQQVMSAQDQSTRVEPLAMQAAEYPAIADTPDVGEEQIDPDEDVTISNVWGNAAWWGVGAAGAAALGWFDISKLEEYTRYGGMSKSSREELFCRIAGQSIPERFKLNRLTRDDIQQIRSRCNQADGIIQTVSFDEIIEDINSGNDSVWSIDVNAHAGSDGNTALLAAVRAGNMYNVALLLSLEKQQLQLTAKNNKGETVFDIVKKQKNKTMLNLLKAPTILQRSNIMKSFNQLVYIPAIYIV